MHPWVNAYRLSYDHHDDWRQLRQEMLDNAQNAMFSVPGSFGDWDALVTGGQGCLADTYASALGCQGPDAIDASTAGHRVVASRVYAAPT